MVYLLILIGFFAFGAAMGSFINLVVDRENRKETFTGGRSHCDFCKKSLGVTDLIPVASFIFLSGKCRYCKKRLSFYYPLTEMLAGILYLVVLAVLSPNFSLGTVSHAEIYRLLIVLVIISSLLIIFFTDLKFGIIPIKPVVVALVASMVMHLLLPYDSAQVINYFLSGVALSSFFLSIFLITRGKGMGFGDVIYAFLMGFILGYPKVILGFYIAVLSGAIIPIVILTIKKKKIRGATIPFGPFLVAGTIISLFWGNLLIEKMFLYLLR